MFGSRLTIIHCAWASKLKARDLPGGHRCFGRLMRKRVKKGSYGSNVQGRRMGINTGGRLSHRCVGRIL